MRRSFGYFTLVVLPVAFGIWAALHFDVIGLLTSHAPRADEARAEARETPRTCITSLGRLEPSSRVLSVSAPTGTRVLQLEVREGQKVSRGDSLAHLDDYPLRKAEKERASARLNESQVLLDADTEHGQALVEQAELEARLIEELMPFDIEALQATVRWLGSDLQKAERDFDRVEKLRTTKAVTEEDWDNRKTDIARLREQCAEAKAKLARCQAARVLEPLTKAAKVKSAKAALRRAQSAAQIESLKAEVQLADAQLERTIIRAPIDGQILKIFTFPGEQISSQPILKMGDTDRMYAVAEVYETDARRVQNGQRASIESPALPSPISGVVDEIGLIIAKNDVLDIDPAARVDARTIEVRIRLDESTVAAVFNHLQVRVEIQTDVGLAKVD